MQSAVGFVRQRLFDEPFLQGRQQVGLAEMLSVGKTQQGLQLPAEMFTGHDLQELYDLRGNLRGNLRGDLRRDWVGHWVADWVGTPLLGTLLIVFLSRWPFAQDTQNATTQHRAGQPGAPPPPGLTGFPEPAQRNPRIDQTWIDL